ncbi:MAG: RNA-binding protein [Candidatus Altiarchaeota archaeon]|nr:RNA-binding protein [Candidatus Altiarchaeota archaeon]
MVKKCSSCGKETLFGYSEFKCPSCGKEKIIRCESCKALVTNYICSCGFQGP